MGIRVWFRRQRREQKDALWEEREERNEMKLRAAALRYQLRLIELKRDRER